MINTPRILPLALKSRLVCMMTSLTFPPGCLKSTSNRIYLKRAPDIPIPKMLLLWFSSLNGNYILLIAKAQNCSTILDFPSFFLTPYLVYQQILFLPFKEIGIRTFFTANSATTLGPIHHYLLPG